MNPSDGVVYLSGPMKGYENYNFETFDFYAGALRAQGYDVISPAETAGGAKHLPREWYFRFDFAVIATCAAVMVMPGWTDSEGAKAEVIMANQMGIPVYELNPDGTRGFRVVNIKQNVMFNLSAV